MIVYTLFLGYAIIGNTFFTFYFHGAKARRKYELTKRRPSIGFEIDGSYKLMERDVACDFQH